MDANAKKPFFWKDHLTGLLTSADARAGFEALLPVIETTRLEDLNKPVRQQRPVLQRCVTVAHPLHLAIIFNPRDVRSVVQIAGQRRFIRSGSALVPATPKTPRYPP